MRTIRLLRELSGDDLHKRVQVWTPYGTATGVLYDMEWDTEWVDDMSLEETHAKRYPVATQVTLRVGVWDASFEMNDPRVSVVVFDDEA